LPRGIVPLVLAPPGACLIDPDERPGELGLRAGRPLACPVVGPRARRRMTCVVEARWGSGAMNTAHHAETIQARRGSTGR